MKAVKYPAAPVSISVARQIAAMWLYEWKLHWRRRPLKVVFLTLAISASISTLMIISGLSASSMRIGDLSGLTLEYALLVKGVFLMSTSMAMLAFMQMLILPLIMVDSAAIDEQDQMMELLRSTPLPGWAYLVGKIGGMWWAGMSAITLSMLIVCVVSWLAMGAYNPIPMLDGWILLSAPVLLFNGGFVLLVGATQPTRRRAVGMGLGILFLSGYIGGIAPSGPLTALNPFNGLFVMALFGISDARLPVYLPVFTLPGVMEFVVGRGLVFLVTALLVGAWWTLRWSDLLLRSKTGEIVPSVPAQQGS
jgi:ABC-type transport system involved in multi-copper enzyme maturation permease subunit